MTMTLRRFHLTMMVVAVALLLTGYSCNPTPPPPVGFSIRTQKSSLNNCFFLCTQNDPHIIVSGQWQKDPYPNPPASLTEGWIYSFAPDETDGDALLPIPGGRARATWIFAEHNGICANRTAYTEVAKAETQSLICYYYVRFSVSPEAFVVDDPPASVQVAGPGISTAYGMPRIQIYDYWGNYVGETTATSIAADGSSFTAALSNITYSGSFGVVILNVQADGSLEAIGGATFSVAGLGDAEPPPIGGCGQDPSDPQYECIMN